MQKQLYDQYSKKMLAVCLRYAKTSFEAEDVLQEGFMKVFKNLEKFKKDCPLEFWIRKIMVNTALKHYKQSMHLSLTTDEQEVKQVAEEEFVLSDFSFEELLQLVRQLAPRYQLVFNLYAIEGYNHREIGEMLGISEGTSKSQYARARVVLKNMLENQEKMYHEKMAR